MTNRDVSDTLDAVSSPAPPDGHAGARGRVRRRLLSASDACENEASPHDREHFAASPRRLNLVLEGGGVRGIGLAGAVAALEEALATEQKFKDTYIAYLAGTSAGAIVAALLGAGYSSHEIADIIAGPEIARFADVNGLSKVPVVGRPISMIYGLFAHLGMFAGDYFLEFIRSKLRAKGVRTFGDLIMPGCERETEASRKYRVHLVASDITRGRMLVLPDDINVEEYGVDPDDLDVALAVRMSISVPFVFRPVRLTGDNGVDSYIVDGGLLSNFPVRLFDAAGTSRRDTLTVGVRILRDRYHSIGFPMVTRAAYALISTAIEAHDFSDTSKAVDLLKWARVIEVNTEAVPIFKFRLSPLEKEILFKAGYRVMSRSLQANFLETAMPVQLAAEEAAERARVPLARVVTVPVSPPFR
ncbi:patatin-like phospholipase family protein [Sorangium cellulosum]|uniref:patatin-like phospholipase family protein n=1 Tax=Sorangium TaxID=39643 RepID=UPI0009D7631A|nr:patatin-like phospholipase family protein [Sorangium cellulosum]